MSKKKNNPTRQQKHRETLLDSGGRYISIELSAPIAQYLEFIKARDSIRTDRQAIAESIELNALTEKPKKK